MSPTRIHKITKIDNYRIFQGWKPSGGVEFARVNLIYGQNGSGKSTLASLLQSCAAYAVDQSDDRDHRHDDVVSAGLQLEVCDPSDTSTSGSSAISLNDRAFWGRVRVFNKDFVRRNLRFEEVDGPQPEALLTIGEKLADAEKKIKELKPELGVARESLEMARKALKEAEDDIGHLGTTLAKKIADDLERAHGFKSRGYNRNNVKKIFDEYERDPAVLGDASMEPLVDRDRATNPAMKPVSIQPLGKMLERDGLDQALELLQASVVSDQLIEQLVGHASRSRWVQEGIRLHAELGECLFCGQELTQDRREALNVHFDESFKNLQAAIDDLVKRLDVSVSVSKAYLDAFPANSDVYEGLREDLRTARQTYDTEHKTYVEAVTQIQTALTEKKNNPFGSPVLPPDLALVAPNTAALDRVVAQHQSKIDSHMEDARKAAVRVEHYHVKEAVPDYSRLKKRVAETQADVDKLDAQVKDLGEQIATLENMDGDPVPGATELTKGLRGLLGRGELTFSVAEDGKHYAIERGGDPATHLSEGEQTAIALLYFLHSVREDKIKGEPPIVIIDDPVSSLDHGILFGASAHIWEESVVKQYVSQVFLLTHNFELFRQWLIQMGGVPKKMREGGYAAFRVRARLDEIACRVPEFELWGLDDSRRKKLRSQYHFLFDQVAATLTDSDADFDSVSQMEAAALVPNTARKLLEGFLSFRSPKTMGDFRGSVRAVIEGCSGLDDSVRTMIVRYAHAHSHLEEADPMKPLELSEAVPFLCALFTFMDHVDGDHFRSMCEALGYDPDALLSVSMSSEPGAPA